LRDLKQVFQDFEKYLGRHDTYGKTGPGAAIKNPIAYFSAEFGFHESIPNYSGGLGILAGDHCKSASDLDLNFVRLVCSIGTAISGNRSIRTASGGN
jgi:Glucan phosphorylase